MQSAVPTKPLRHGMVNLGLVHPQANHVVAYQASPPSMTDRALEIRHRPKMYQVQVVSNCM